ncbi:hypothetical protein C0995_014251 [Termitomyces sp. Mi166|nr:hypothetical protein C0995_014251 [Termitomyces sp. Mi166\
MVADDTHTHARVMFALIRRPTLRATNKEKSYVGSLETFLSLGLGSAANGLTLSNIPCANHDVDPCSRAGIMLCRKHPMLDPGWQPRWIQEEREPRFNNAVYSEHPAYDCLRLSHNETERGAADRDFKLCFAASGDIRNLVQTINGLPAGYRGKCDILLNDIDAITVNRNLVILYALLGSGPSIEQSAEIAMHLMYSSALPPTIAAYLRGCVRVIYGEGANERQMSFRCSLRTRGRGKIYSMQSTMAMRRPMEMFHSTYDLRKGLKSKRTIITDTEHVDDVDRAFASLRPAHRLALAHFRRKGVLAPFALSTRGFTEPNRLMYTAGGNWLGHARANPLEGWNVSDVLATGAKHNVDSADIIGCLFFHVKEELIEFARRMKEFRIDLHLTQFSPPLLSKGISIGALPAFTEGCFDRVDTADLADREGIPELLFDWGPMGTKKTKLEGVLAHGTKSPTLMRLLESLDAFVDHGKAFREYLCAEQVDVTSKDLGLRVRRCNRVNPKRFGVSIDAPQQRLPDLLRDEFYNLFTIGGGDLLTRFVEFEATQ